jgi:branched-chain amino acid transport system substrate-binding protein
VAYRTASSTASAYESVANASGGIRGRPVHFEIHDDHSSPVIAVQLVTELLAKNPQLIMGSTYIAGCAAEEPLVRNGPVEFCFSPGLVTTQHNVFASSVANTYIIPATLKFIRERKYARVAVISATDASGSVADKITLSALARPEDKNLTAVDYEHFNPTDISVSAQTARIKAGNPQAIIVYATGSAFGTVLRALNDAGVNIPVFTSAVNMNPIQLAQYSNFLPKELIFNGEDRGRKLTSAGSRRDRQSACRLYRKPAWLRRGERDLRFSQQRSPRSYGCCAGLREMGSRR